jgi:hypothetical protein
LPCGKPLLFRRLLRKMVKALAIHDGVRVLFSVVSNGSMSAARNPEQHFQTRKNPASP